MKYQTNIITIPEKDKVAVNAALELLGYGPDTFTLPLGTGNKGKITEYICSWNILPHQLTKLKDIITTKNSSATYDVGKKFEDVLKDKDAKVFKT